jgi:hypothetical protein
LPRKVLHKEFSFHSENAAQIYDQYVNGSHGLHTQVTGKKLLGGAKTSHGKNSVRMILIFTSTAAATISTVYFNTYVFHNEQ